MSAKFSGHSGVNALFGPKFRVGVVDVDELFAPQRSADSDWIDSSLRRTDGP
jgi:hypothetical protein